MQQHGVIGIEFSSSSVVATALKTTDGPFELLAEHYQPVYFKEPASPEEFISAMHSALTKALPKAADSLLAAGLTTTDIFCVYGSPWHASRITTFTKEYKKPTPLSAKQIEEMVSAQVEEKRAELEKKAGIELRCIESRHILTHLNGYRITKPIAATVSDISITHVAAYVAKEDAEELEKRIRKITPGAKIHHTTVASWMYPKACAPTDTIIDSCIVHVSGETTDIAVLTDDALVALLTIPMGIHHVLRALTKEAGIAYPMNDSLLSMMHDGMLDASAGEKVKIVLEKTFQEWIGSIRASLDDAKIIAMPADIFLHAEPKRIAAASALLTHPDAIKKCFGTTTPRILDVSRLFN